MRTHHTLRNKYDPLYGKSGKDRMLGHKLQNKQLSNSYISKKWLDPAERIRRISERMQCLRHCLWTRLCGARYRAPVATDHTPKISLFVHARPDY